MHELPSIHDKTTTVHLTDDVNTQACCLTRIAIFAVVDLAAATRTPNPQLSAGQIDPAQSRQMLMKKG